MAVRHFLTLPDCTTEELARLVARAAELKCMHGEGVVHKPLAGKTLAMVFQLNSTRTRVAFETGMHQLGGHALFLGRADTQLGRGEPVEDTARVLSEMVDAVMVRTLAHEEVERFAAASSVPVINGMTNRFHPCQLLADVQTFVEFRGGIAGAKVAFVGDGYNMCNSYIRASGLFGFGLRIAAPRGHEPDAAILRESACAELVPSPKDAVAGADLVVTDVWSSLGHDDEAEARRRGLLPAISVTPDLLDCAAKDALFMHCPASTSRRGDQRTPARRPALGGLGGSRQPPALAEGIA